MVSQLNSKLPLVSVILPTYNRHELASRAVKTVLGQTYVNIECIVIDDHSTDGTADHLLDIASSDSRLQIIQHIENRHVSAARNTGLKAASGEFIAFLDDDDTWLPDKIEKQVRLLSSSAPQVGLVYCWFDVYRDKQRIGGRHPNLSGNVFDKMMLRQPLGNASTVVVRRSVLDVVGGFDEDLPRGNDGDFIRRVARHFHVDVVPEVLVHYFVDHDGHPRITGIDRKSKLAGIHGHEAKLKKFPDELAQRPGIHAALLSIIGRDYARIGMAREAFKRIWTAIKIRPLNASTYLNAFKALIDYQFRQLK